MITMNQSTLAMLGELFKAGWAMQVIQSPPAPTMFASQAITIKWTPPANLFNGEPSIPTFSSVSVWNFEQEFTQAVEKMHVRVFPISRDGTSTGLAHAA